MKVTSGKHFGGTAMTGAMEKNFIKNPLVEGLSFWTVTMTDPI